MRALAVVPAILVDGSSAGSYTSPPGDLHTSRITSSMGAGSMSRKVRF
jgi:hypothetical protein